METYTIKGGGGLMNVLAWKQNKKGVQEKKGKRRGNKSKWTKML